MQLKRRTLLASTFFTLAFGFVIYSFANPGVAACIFSDSNQVHSSVDEQLITESKTRIQNMFGAPASNPIIVFFNNSRSFWSFNLNQYGSTHFIGHKVCVMIGPKGENIDVVSHELMHAEIGYRMGDWARFTQLPVWFDEGLAVQVDLRAKYILQKSDIPQARYVKNLTSASKFFVENDELLTKNYASAKAVVSQWTASIGNSSVYSRLERIRAGEPFDQVTLGE